MRGHCLHWLCWFNSLPSLPSLPTNSRQCLHTHIVNLAYTLSLNTDWKESDVHKAFAWQRETVSLHLLSTQNNIQRNWASIYENEATPKITHHEIRKSEKRMRPKKWRNAQRRAKLVYFEHLAKLAYVEHMAKLAYSEHPAKLAYFDEHPLPCGSLQASCSVNHGSNLCKSWD